VVVIFLLQCIFSKDVIDEPNKQYDLQKDGFVVIKNVLAEKQIEQIKNSCNKNDYYNMKKSLIQNNQVLDLVKQNIKNNDYVFQDYIWIIKKSAVHTCHRDNNGDFFNETQQYPSYTLLIYLEDTEKCLGVVPYSHKSLYSYNINFTNPVKYLPCKVGDAILFNANLIHVGAINKTDSLRVQMKVSHKEDLDALSYYEDYNKVLNQENKLPHIIKNTQKNLSCAFPFISDLTQNENINSARGSDNGANVGFFQKTFSYMFYGNSNFYDLPNAF
jgi:ectoine hydroxylase-related dioxygenase (phytanoyl-CoA dioxygenase family)